MAKTTNTDWALAVGITQYPEFEKLDGPEADATDFYEWVTSKDGGAVKTNRSRLIVSSQFKKPASSISAQPAAAAVEAFFEQLDAEARNNERFVGRRLYIYFSGHGFAPSDSETALLMANAAKNRLKHHVPGKAWANLFYRSGYFEEVLLFMDCCRNILPQTIPNLPSVSVPDNPQAIQTGRRFFAFATKWGAEARERRIAKGKSRGVFTTALMEGLRHGKACAPGTNRITAKSLRGYLFNNMAEFLSKADKENPEIPKEPDIEPSQGQSDFTIVELKNPPAMEGARIVLGAATTGKTINIRNGQFEIIKTSKAKPPEWTVQLPRGLYLAEIVGGPAAKAFEVKAAPKGKELVRVDFK
jgi:uncharacterized caspase-like protein